MADLGKPRFENGARVTIAGLAYSYKPVALNKIPAQWDLFRTQSAEISGGATMKEYGLWYGVLSQQGIIQFVTGVEIGQFANAPGNFSRVMLVPRPHAVFSVNGGVANVRPTVDLILKQWLPKSGKELAPSAPGAPDFFEFYPKGYLAAQAGTGPIEMWVPLKK